MFTSNAYVRDAIKNVTITAYTSIKELETNRVYQLNQHVNYYLESLLLQSVREGNETLIEHLVNKLGVSVLSQSKVGYASSPLLYWLVKYSHCFSGESLKIWRSVKKIFALEPNLKVDVSLLFYSANFDVNLPLTLFLLYKILDQENPTAVLKLKDFHLAKFDEGSSFALLVNDIRGMIAEFFLMLVCPSFKSLLIKRISYRSPH